MADTLESRCKETGMTPDEAFEDVVEELEMMTETCNAWRVKAAKSEADIAALRAENERLRAELANAEAKQWDGTTGPSIAGTMIVLEGADAIAKRDATIAELRGLCREADYALQMEMSRCSAVDHAENACGDCGTRHELAKRLREAGKGGEDGT